MRTKGKFKIVARMLQGSIFTFNNVDGYIVEAGDIISFKDNKTGKIKKIHASNCEIQPIGDSR